MLSLLPCVTSIKYLTAPVSSLGRISIVTPRCNLLYFSISSSHMHLLRACFTHGAVQAPRTKLWIRQTPCMTLGTKSEHRRQTISSLSHVYLMCWWSSNLPDPWLEYAPDGGENKFWVFPNPIRDQRKRTPFPGILTGSRYRENRHFKASTVSCFACLFVFLKSRRLCCLKRHNNGSCFLCPSYGLISSEHSLQSKVSSICTDCRLSSPLRRV